MSDNKCNQLAAKEKENAKLRDNLQDEKIRANAFLEQTIKLKAKVDELRAVVEKIALCFPDKIPAGSESVEFNIPAYIIEELKSCN